MPDYKVCTGCHEYRGEVASLIQPYHPVDMDAFSQKTPTYKTMNLKDATKDFLRDYINCAATDYGTTTTSQLRKNLKMTREGLTKLIRGINSENSLADISEKVEGHEDGLNNEGHINVPRDPIAKYFVQEARKNPEGYDIKRDVAQFKKTYVNNTVRTFGFYNAFKELGFEEASNLETREIINYGIDEAAESLGLSRRRVQDLVKAYNKEVSNSEQKEEREAMEDNAAEKASREIVEEIKKIEEIEKDRNRDRGKPLENMLN